jgi:hypothetical protein
VAAPSLDNSASDRYCAEELLILLANFMKKMKSEQAVLPNPFGRIRIRIRTFFQSLSVNISNGTERVTCSGTQSTYTEMRVSPGIEIHDI